MQISYTVHSARRGPARLPVMVGEQQVAAFTADGLVVELLSGDMSVTLQIATDLDEAEALFQEGATVVATFAAPAE